MDACRNRSLNEYAQTVAVTVRENTKGAHESGISSLSSSNVSSKLRAFADHGSLRLVLSRTLGSVIIRNRIPELTK